jgi:hypothetical protein
VLVRIRPTAASASSAVTSPWRSKSARLARMLSVARPRFTWLTPCPMMPLPMTASVSKRAGVLIGHQPLTNGTAGGIGFGR